MSIKKIIKTLPVLILIAITFSANASSTFVIFNSHHHISITNNDSLRLEQIKNRLAEIQGMDLSNLSGKEKKELKKELITMKKEATSMDEGNHHNGVYLSIGAVIIIILLLILLIR